MNPEDRAHHPARVYRVGAYNAQVTPEGLAISHITDPADVITHIPAGENPQASLEQWHEKTKDTYR